MVHTLILSTPSGRIYEQPPSTTQRKAVLLQVECFSPTTNKPIVNCVCAIGAREVALIDSKGAVYVLNLEQNRYRRICTGLTPCQSLLPLPIDGDGLAIATGKEAKIYQLNGQLLATLRGHKDRIDSLDVNYLRKWLLTQSQDTVIIWDMGGWRRVRTVNTEASKYVLCRFTPDSQSMIVNLKDGSLYQMGLAKFNTEKQFKAEEGVRLFGCNATFTQVYGVTQGGIAIWDCKRPQSPVSSLALPAGIASVTQFALINDSHFAVLSDSGVLYVVSLETDRTIGEIRVEAGSVTGFASGRGGFCVKGSDGSARVMDWGVEIEGMMGKPQTHVSLTRKIFDVPDPVLAPPSSHPSSSDHSFVILRKDGLDFNNLSTSSSSSVPPQPCQHHLFADIYKAAKLDPEQSRLQHCNLRRLLQYSGEYPERYRVLVWRFLLQVPNNKEAFEGLYNKGMHPALVNLHQNPLLKPAHLYSKLERVLSALTYWSPIFGEADFIPVLLHPLALICRGDDLTLFELVVALFLNWLQHWLEFYPTPPLNYLQSIDNVIKHHEPALHRHFQDLKCPPKAYIWPSLRYLFAPFLGVEGVTRLFDFIFTDWDKPQLLIFIATAIVLKHKNILLKMTKSSEISAFFTTPRQVKLTKIIEIAYSLFNETPSNVAIVGFDQKLPISVGQYPLFTGYPKFIVEERQGIREEIISDEERLMQKQTTIADLTSQLADFTEKEKAYGVKREQMAQLDKEWRSMAQVEEQLRAQERLAFEKETALRKQREITEMEVRFTSQTEKQKASREQELQMLEKEVSRGALAGQYALEAKIADEALRAMEQRAAKSIAETIDQRTSEELHRRQLLVEGEHKEQAELRDRLTQAQWEREDEAQSLSVQLKREREQQESDTRRLSETSSALEKAHRLQSLEHELKLLEVSKERRLRQIAEEELERSKAVATLQGKKRELLTAEESHHFSDLKRREEFHEKKLAEERQNTIQSVTVANQKELMTQQDEIQRLERDKVRKQAEGRLIELRKESEQRAIEGERRFQEEILEMDAEAREKRQANLEKLFAQKEEEEKLYFQRVIQNEKASLDRMAVAEREARSQQIELIEEQRRRTQKAQEELAKAHRERIQQENDIERMKMVQQRMRGTEEGRKPEAGEGKRQERKSEDSSKSSSSGAAEPSQNHSRRAVTFHSTYTSPEFTNRLTSPEYSAHDHGSECSCSCHSESGSSTPPLPTRSVHEEDYSSELSDGSELILSHSGSSFASRYSSLSNSKR